MARLGGSRHSPFHFHLQPSASLDVYRGGWAMADLRRCHHSALKTSPTTPGFASAAHSLCQAPSPLAVSSLPERPYCTQNKVQALLRDPRGLACGAPAFLSDFSHPTPPFKPRCCPSDTASLSLPWGLCTCCCFMENSCPRSMQLLLFPCSGLISGVVHRQPALTPLAEHPIHAPCSSLTHHPM